MNMFQEAVRAGSERDYEKAVFLLNKIIIETDSIPDAFLYLGRSYHALGNYSSAVRMLKLYISYEEESPKGYFFLGRTYLSIGLPGKSARYLNKALSLSPENPEILSLLGVSLLKLRKIDHAVALLEQAYEIQPDNKSIYNAYLNSLYAKGVREFYYGDPDMARQILEYLKNNNRSSDNIDLLLAVIEKENGNITKSLELYKNVIKRNPDDEMLKVQIVPIMIKTGEQAEAARLIAELTEKSIPLNINNLTGNDINRILAVEYFSKNKLQAALHYARRIIHENYYDNEMHMLMGEVFRQLKQNEKAENHFNLVLKRDKTKLEARYGKIMIYWTEEKYQDLYNEIKLIEKYYPDDEIAQYYKALTICRLDYPFDDTINMLKEVLENNKNDPFIINAVGYEFLKHGDAASAEKWFLNSLKISDMKEAYEGLIKSYFKLNRKNKINSVFSKYLKIYPDDNLMRKYFINNLYELKKYKAAIREIEKYNMYTENISKMEYLLAKCYFKTEDYGKAVVFYRKLLQENPDNINYLMTYSYCLEKLERSDEAVKLLEKSLDYFRNSSRILLTLGVIYFRENKYEKAMEKFRKVLEKNSKDWRAYYNMSRVYEIQGLGDMAEKFHKHYQRYKKMLDK